MTRAGAGKVSWALLCVALAGSRAAGAEVSYPPSLPGGRTVARHGGSEAFLKPPASLTGVAGANAAPTVDFLY